MTPKETVQLITEKGIQFVDFQFGDLYGTLHHFTMPARQIDEDVLEKGIPFDGSSIRSWKSIDKSDMLFMPDLDSTYVDPFRTYPTLATIGHILEPRTGQVYDRCPRSIAKKALAYLRSTGIGDMAFFGPEPEFFIFDGIRYDVKPHHSLVEIISGEAPWTSGDDDGCNLGHKIRNKMGYFPVSPSDTLTDIRSEIVQHMMAMGMDVVVHHHEVATAGQCEIGVKFGTILSAGDNVHKLKYAVKNTALKHGKTATFMPKPLFGDNGSGMHVHASIWREGRNLFAGDGYGRMSKEALWAVGGLIKHGKSIQVITNPSVNSFRRLVPGYEAPVNLAYSATNRSAAIRIPHALNDKGRRIEFRCPDSAGSPYLVFTAILMAMVDGIQNQIDSGAPVDKNIYDLPPEELANIPCTCRSLEEALDTLEADKDWLLAGDVFTPDTLEAYVDFKRTEEVDPIKLRPNPYEYHLYYDA